MHQNAIALLLTVLAGSATLVGGLLAYTMRNSIKPVPFAGALGFAGGVMVFVSFVEIYTEGFDHLREGFLKKWPRYSPADADRAVSAIGMMLFFTGWILASILDGGLHLVLDAHHERNGQSDEKVKEVSGVSQDFNLLSSSSARPSQLLHYDDVEVRRRSVAWWRRMVDSKYFKALVGTENLDKGAKLIAEKQFHADCHKITRLGYFTALVLALHNIPEGIATFAGGAADVRLGVGLAIAIGIHNIPEGLAVAVPILFGTGSFKKALLYTGVSGLAEPLGGLMAWWIMGDNPQNIAFGVLFFLTAGIMVNVALKELLFSAIRYDSGNRITSISFVAGMAVMAISLVALDYAGT